MRQQQRTRSDTQKIRPWSKLPGVVAYVVVDPEGLLTDRWGEPTALHLDRAAAFRAKSRAGGLDGSHVIEPCGHDLRLLSVVRRDGWFVHVWVWGEAEVAGIISVVGG
ncbi:MAG TPA: hypothetical protein VL400_27015 [Polyangiaceae bacterium]|jgi:hypothetical protein|nr:hypothetical protein [Polyangiaceae bacterium]